MKRGAVFALSGVDCAGKSTQVDLLLESLRARGHSPVLLYIRPGSTPGLRAMRGLLGAFTRRKPVRTGVSKEPGRYPRRATNLGHPLRRKLWLMVALLDLLWVCCVRIRFLKLRGRSVVCNRYLLDCVVDFRVNFPADHVENGVLFRLLRRFCVRPDVAYCLSIPAALTQERAHRKSRYHWETLDVLEARWREYGAQAADLGVQVLDGTRSQEELARSIQHVALGTLPTRELQHERLP